MKRKWMAMVASAAVLLAGIPATLSGCSSKQTASIYSAQIGDVRVQLLSDTLARIELKGPAGFEDRTTYHVVSRDFPGTSVERVDTAEEIRLVNPVYTVHVPTDAVSLDGVSITDSVSGQTLWEYTGLPSGEDTYLPAPGSTPDAWAIADSPRVVPAQWGYSPMPEGEEDAADLNGWDDTNDAPDLYVFLPGRDASVLRADFVSLTGSAELVPLKALGLWHSWYHPYSADDVMDTIDRYRKEGFPLDNFVVDTDWRVNASTGYDINTKLFPDMEAFLTAAHDEKNVSIMFNDHPEAVNDAQALSQEDLLYRNENLRELLSMGLDTWWFDRNWTKCIVSPFDGISKESFGMYLYQAITLDERADRRPLIMGNVDGIDNGVRNTAPDLASHRFSIQWTGDIENTSASLRQEITNMVNSGALTATPYVSADIGGHFDIVSSKQWTRWSQYAALSPIFRYHSTAGNRMDRAPWNYSDAAQETAQAYVAMRYRLMPLLYSLSYESYETGLPIARRLDFQYPAYAEAQDDTQYLLGDGVLVAPIWEGSDGATREVFIPDGRWIDVWTGESYEGPQTITVTHSLETSPIFVRSGTIVPLVDGDVDCVDEKPWDAVTLDVYPSTRLSGTATLHEDDQVSNEYKDGKVRETALSTSYDAQTGEFAVDISKAEGRFDGDNAFSERTWTVRVHAPEGFGELTGMTLGGKAVEWEKIEKDSSASPFAITGGAADGAVYTVTFTAPLNSESALRFTFSSTADETLPTYSEVPVTLSVEDHPALGTIDLTALGTDDWTYYGETVVHKANGSGVLADAVSGAAAEKTETSLVSFAWSDGKETAQCAAVAQGAYTAGSFTLTAAVDSTEKQIVLYLGGENACGRLGISDGTDGGAYMLDLSGLSGAFSRKIVLNVRAEQPTQLTITYRKTQGDGAVALYAAAVGDPLPASARAVECTATLENAPASASLSDGTRDWVHVEYVDLYERKDTAVCLLSLPQVAGDPYVVTDYSTAISASGGMSGNAVTASHSGVSTAENMSIAVASCSEWRELRVYLGCWKGENTIEITDETGAVLETLSFKGSTTASTRCLTVRFRSQSDTTLSVKWKKSAGSGNVSLAGYSVSEIIQ